MKVLKLADLDLKGKRVFIRADLNVPQADDGAVTDDTRIRASVPGIRMALDKGAAVMVTSHLGRPKEGEFSQADSLAPVAARLAELLGRDVPLVRDWVDGVDVKPGQVVLLENCRFNKGEKKNDEALARKMAALCDVYANDAFGTAHRAEATTHGIAKFAKVACAGPLLAAELDALGRALASPKRPLVAIVAGSKVSTKLTILKTPVGEGRPAHRGRRHRQHLHAGRGAAHRQVAVRARPRPRGEGDRGDDAGARRGGARSRRRGLRQGLRRRRARHDEGREGASRTTT